MSDEYTFDYVSDAGSMIGDGLERGFEGLKAVGKQLRGGQDAFASRAGSFGEFLEGMGSKGEEGVSWARRAAKYDVPRDEMLEKVEGVGQATKGATSLANALTRFDIVRDFTQVISLFVSGLVYPTAFTDIFGNVFSLFTLTLPELITVEASVVRNVWFWFLFLVSLGLFSTIIRARITTDDVREGLEAQHWIDSSKKKRLLVQLVLTVLTTLFMPCSEAAIRIAVCDKEWIPVFDSCYSVVHILYIVPSAIMFVVISLGLPFTCYKLVSMYKPLPPLHNAEGHPIPPSLRKAVYRNELKRDKTPYGFLYFGYEHSWAHYKVFIMLVKLVLVLVIAVFSRNNSIYDSESKTLQVIQVSLVLAIMGGFAAFAFRVSPFLLRENDLIDRCGRVTSVLTALIGLLIAVEVWEEDGWAWVLNALHFLNVIFMVLLFFTGVELCSTFCKNTFHILDMSPDPESNQRWFFSPSFNLLTARKQLVWHAFWDGLFMTDPEFAPPEEQKWAFAQPSSARTRTAMRGGFSSSEGSGDGGDVDAKEALTGNAFQSAAARAASQGLTAKDTPPYLQNFMGTVGERHYENKRIVQVVGFDAYAEAVADNLNEEARVLHDRIVRYLLGMDVYYEGIPEDGELDSLTCFGRAYALPFPFFVVMVYDDDDDHVFLRGGLHTRLPSFVDQNEHEEIKRRRFLRTRIRALDGRTVYFYHKAQITKWKSKTVGNQTKRYKVTVPFTFRRGVLRLTSARRTAPFKTSEGTINISEGFGFAIHYADGEGVDHEGKSWKNERLVLRDTFFEHNERNEFVETDKISRLLYHESNQKIWKPRHKRVMRATAEYRRHWLKEFRSKADTLSYEFLFHIYNSSYVPYKSLVAYLSQYEANPLVRNIPTQHRRGLRMLYERLRWFDSHPAAATWFTFWADVWKNNEDTFEDVAEYMDPSSASAIAYHPLDQEDLEILLDDIEVRAWFSRRLLDKLYMRMDELLEFEDKNGRAHPALRCPDDFYRSALVDALDTEDIDSLGSSGSGGSSSYLTSSGGYGGGSSTSSGSSEYNDDEYDDEYDYESDYGSSGYES